MLAMASLLPCLCLVLPGNQVVDGTIITFPGERQQQSLPSESMAQILLIRFRRMHTIMSMFQDFSVVSQRMSCPATQRRQHHQQNGAS